MSDNLQELSALLREGLRRSQQGSYGRRTPADAAVPYLRQARNGLRMIADQQPENAQAWRQLSQAAEALLDYGEARAALEKALALSGVADRRDLKKLASLRELEAWWDGLGLTPPQLAELGRCLEKMVFASPCDHTPRHTRMWLEHSGLRNPDQIIRALRDRGGYCDCEVLNNVVRP
jgi:tetratricopeptide (TPR) repeat protein